MALCICHVTYAFYSRSTILLPECKGTSCLKQLKIWTLSKYNLIQTNSHLVPKWLLNHSAKLSKWLNCEYLSVWCIWPCVVIMSHMHFWGTLWSRRVILKIKWLQQDLNPQPLSLKMNTQPFSHTDKMIELRCVYLYVWCIWLCVLIMSHVQLWVNLHICLKVRELFAQDRHRSES